MSTPRSRDLSEPGRGTAAETHRRYLSHSRTGERTHCSGPRPSSCCSARFWESFRTTEIW
eukprot:scaffold6978_cov64-Phaeocystis_antarctica.AAC.9